MGSTALHSLSQHAQRLCLENLQGNLGALLLVLLTGHDKARGGELEAWLEASSQAHPRQPMPLRPIWVQADFPGGAGNGDDVLILHHQLSLLSIGQVDAEEQVIETRPKEAGEILVINGVEELGEVHVAAQGIGYSAVSQGTHGTVESQRVVMELQQALLLTELQDIHTPENETSNSPLHREKSVPEYSRVLAL